MGAVVGSLCHADGQICNGREAADPEKVIAEKIVPEIEVDTMISESSEIQRQAEDGMKSPRDVRRSLLLKKVLSIDTDLLRGVPLKASLQQFGRLWRVSPSDLPEKGREALWAHSANVACK